MRPLGPAAWVNITGRLDSIDFISAYVIPGSSLKILKNIFNRIQTVTQVRNFMLTVYPRPQDAEQTVHSAQLLKPASTAKQPVLSTDSPVQPAAPGIPF